MEMNTRLNSYQENHKMIKIYGQVMSRAPRCAWALEEMGVAYEIVPINQFAGEAQTPEFLEINPNGKVPAMVDGDLKLFESMAINLYLARKYGGKLWPADEQDQARAVQWSFWAMTEIEPPFVALMMQKLMTEESERDMGRVKEAEDSLPRPLKVLDQHLSDARYLLGDSFTIADLNLASVFSIAGLIQFDFSDYPNVDRWLNLCLSREKFQAVNKHDEAA